MARVARSLELLAETLAGKQQTIAFPVLFLLFGRNRNTASISRLRSFLLLLFHGFAFPAACHRLCAHRAPHQAPLELGNPAPAVKRSSRKSVSDDCRYCSTSVGTALLFKPGSTNSAAR